MGMPDPSEEAKVSRFPSQSPYASLKPIICLVVLSLETNSTFYEQVLLPALRQVLEQDPYFWQVVHSHDKHHKDNPQHNITEWMNQASIYVIDISEQHPDTFVELGRICESQKQKSENVPIIVLERKGNDRSKMSPRDGVMRIDYTVVGDKHVIDDLAAELRRAFDERGSIQKLNTTKQAHYLSRFVLMSEAKVLEEDAQVLERRYQTMEYFIHATPKNIARQIRGLKVDMARLYQQEIADLLNDLRNQ